MLSGRYADVLSGLFLGYSTLWYTSHHKNVKGLDKVTDFAMQVFVCVCVCLLECAHAGGRREGIARCSEDGRKLSSPARDCTCTVSNALLVRSIVFLPRRQAASNFCSYPLCLARVFVHAKQKTLADIEDAFFGIFANFPSRTMALAMRTVAFPTGRCYSNPSDTLTQEVSQLMSSDTAVRVLTLTCNVVVEKTRSKSGRGRVCSL